MRPYLLVMLFIIPPLTLPANELKQITLSGNLETEAGILKWLAI
ncbi:MAG: hypothetical protein PQJ50_12735 [Spirochaetales bacterium]|nr:hypothetical protein [Spirochaetales bacterium]